MKTFCVGNVRKFAVYRIIYICTLCSKLCRICKFAAVCSAYQNQKQIQKPDYCVQLGKIQLKVLALLVLYINYTNSKKKFELIFRNVYSLEFYFLGFYEWRVENQRQNDQTAKPCPYPKKAINLQLSLAIKSIYT